VIGRNAIRFIDFETSQYELYSVMIDVQCPFDLNSRIPVELSLTLVEDSDKKAACFFLMTNKVRVVKNKQTRIELKFLSFQAEKRFCRLSFFSEAKG